MTPLKPPLTVVDPGFSGVQPPRPLGQAGRAVWDRVQGEYAIVDSGGTELLQQICEAIDTIQQLGAEITADGGPVIRSRSGSKSHPALRDLLAHRAFVARGLQRLGLNLEPVKSVGRPSSGIGWVPPSR